jgi:starch phosphorylase
MDVRKFFIKPLIPENLLPLQELAFNMWSCWEKDAEKLFHRLDPQLFRELNHNPVELLYRLSPQRLAEAAKNRGFLYELGEVYERFQGYLNFKGSYATGGEDAPFSRDNVIAYICTEYGLHESLPVYSGGLAVLAGDQLKAVSDVGCHMVSFGLLYRYGYFKQHIAADGQQLEEFRENTWYLSPVQEVVGGDGQPLHLEVPLKGRNVVTKLWRIQVGRVPLYLLDTNVHQNPPELRRITDMLYDPDRRTRLEQELILGRGSIIALRALGLDPKIYHLNEGHTAFAVLERLLDLVANRKHSLEEARNIIRYSTVFTTHTPVLAGNENFADELIREYLAAEVKALGLTMDEFLALGRIRKEEPKKEKDVVKGQEKEREKEKEKVFWLPALALRFARRANGVSNIHAQVSGAMWRDLFPTMHGRELPIDGVTNGVHLQSWLSLQMTELFDRYVGPDYGYRADDPDQWRKIETIPASEIWNAHRRRKEQVLSFIRRRISWMIKRRGYFSHKVKDVDRVLNPDYLTIGFARRFASYKRGNLILHDPKRLAAMITNQDKPIQLVFAGKAHPADGVGKDIIKQVIDFIHAYPVENHVVFLEDYDINVARHLVQGVDVWLNTPRRPMEASGTSGMKAGINGVLNLSILDGWWTEAFNGENGWAINVEACGEDPAVVDEAEANQLYELLENDVTDLFYSRGEHDVPLEWVRLMKNSMASVCRDFNMHRTVHNYLHKFYLPQMEMGARLTADDCALLRKLARHRRDIDAIWSQVHIRDYFTNVDGRLPVSGEQVNIDCYAYLGDADEKLLGVELFYCQEGDKGSCMAVPLAFVERYEDRVAKYSGSFTLEGTGLQEISVRLIPADPDFREVYPQYVKWKD